MPDDDFGRFQKELAAQSAQAGKRREADREADLREKLAAKNVEYQALRARSEMDKFRQEMCIRDLEKQLSLCEAEIARLKPVLEQLMSQAPDHAERPEPVERVAPPAPVVVAVDTAEIAELRGQLQSAREEYEKLRLAMDSSLALKAARSIGRLLGMGARQ